MQNVLEYEQQILTEEAFNNLYLTGDHKINFRKALGCVPSAAQQPPNCDYSNMSTSSGNMKRELMFSALIEEIRVIISGTFTTSHCSPRRELSKKVQL